MKVCLIGVTHPCHNPRLVREADALVDAGHDVRVVAAQNSERLRQKDVRLVAKRRWRFDPVEFVPAGVHGKIRSFAARGVRRLSQELSKWISDDIWLYRGYVTAYSRILQVATRESADWFIAHTQGALPIAAAAAQKWQARLGFDCEDLLAESDSDPAEVVRRIERTYLPECDYVSAASKRMAERLVAHYNIPEPVVLYNVFPLELAQGMAPPAQRPENRVLRLHWFSQVVGPGRGIEDAVAAVGQLGGKVELHLRGSLYKSYRLELEAYAKRCGAAGALFFYPQIDHDDLIRSMEGFDVGLALERTENPNRSLTVSNKIFSYALAGLAIVGTTTPGQLEVLDQIPHAGSYSVGDVQALARLLTYWCDNRDELQAAREASWRSARERYCWDEQKDLFERTVGARSAERSENLTVLPH